MIIFSQSCIDAHPLLILILIPKSLCDNSVIFWGALRYSTNTESHQEAVKFLKENKCQQK